MDAYNRLKEIFPGANESTELILLGPGTKVKLGRQIIELAEYSVGEGKFIYAAFLIERNAILVRL